MKVPQKIGLPGSFPFFMGFLLILSVNTGCENRTEFSPIPQIWYKSFNLIDTIDALGNQVSMGVLTFDFRDGDGDFGLPLPNENDPPELQHNLFINGFFMLNGGIQPIPESVPIHSFQFRIPDFADQVYGKPFEGKVRVEMLFYSNPYNAILYDFYITDRSGNQSNVEQTEIIYGQ